MRTFDDLVDLADSGEDEGRVLGGKSKRGDIWRKVEVENAPGTFVFSSTSTTWCYEVTDLLANQRRRHAIKRTAAQRRAMNQGPEAYAAFVAQCRDEDGQPA